MSGSIDPGDVSPHVVVHFAEKFPATKTACGTLGPAVGRWRYVSCPSCLDVAPVDPRIEERRRFWGLPARAR